MKKICFKYFGFTLAEVLITLGIIGVVASITIPILNNAYVNAQKGAGIRRAISTLSNGYTMAKVHNNTDFACTYVKDSSGNIDYANVQRSGCNDLWQALKAELKAVTTCDRNTSANYFGECLPSDGVDDTGLGGGCSGFTKTGQKISNSMILADGTYFYMYDSGASMIYPMFAYDINGFKGPNKYGSDVFTFMFIDHKLNPGGCAVGVDNALNYITGTK